MDSRQNLKSSSDFESQMEISNGKFIPKSQFEILKRRSGFCILTINLKWKSGFESRLKSQMEINAVEFRLKSQMESDYSIPNGDFISGSHFEKLNSTLRFLA